ncbi:MAG: fibrobacter succinogenes major paralogous domain-containing protein [Bacteroidales bacterium]|nr:fibrobacter succinogenes major paralogous domain-containing protein [Bacteroidales bacterium]
MKRLVLAFTAVLFFALMFSSCKKDETKNYKKEYPSTAIVLYNAVTDIEGNQYDAVQIGNQVWMAENLRSTKYPDGSTIPMGSSYSYTEPYLYVPGNNGSIKKNMPNVPYYGYLYNWQAVMHGANSSETGNVQGICPNGWHVPSDAEWRELTNNVNNSAKELASTWGWTSTDELDAPGNNQSTNNVTGFSAPPAGLNTGINNLFLGSRATFWSSTGNNNQAYDYYIYYLDSKVHSCENSKCLAFSVRCVRD